MYGSLFVVMAKLNRILDAQNMNGPFGIGAIDYGRQRRCFSRTSRPRDEHDAIAQMYDFRQLCGKLEICEGWHRIRDYAHYDGVRPTLPENVHAEPAHRRNRVREIGSAFFFQLFPGETERSHQLIGDLAGV